MIHSCHDRAVQQLLDRKFSRKFKAIEKAARFRLALLDATSLRDLNVTRQVKLRWIAGNKPTCGQCWARYQSPSRRHAPKAGNRHAITGGLIDQLPPGRLNEADAAANGTEYHLAQVSRLWLTGNFAA
jgi:hypothetical protein